MLDTRSHGLLEFSSGWSIGDFSLVIVGTFLPLIVNTAPFQLTAGFNMDELSYLGIGFAVAIFVLAILMGTKLASKKAYH